MDKFTGLLLGGAFMVLVSFIVLLFFMYQAKKQIKSKE